MIDKLSRILNFKNKNVNFVFDKFVNSSYTVQIKQIKKLKEKFFRD